MRITFLLAFTLIANVAHAQPSTPASSTPPSRAAQTWQVDVRWAPWLGCWRAEDDLPGAGMRLCITPETVAGVKMQTVVGLETRSSETVIPDRITRPVSDADCRGTGRAEWSRSNQRLFRFNDVTCGTESANKLSGISFLLDGPVLVDVQFADRSDNKSVRVRRFRRATNQTLSDGTLAPRSADVRSSAFGAPWTVQDVIEASGKVPSDAVQAAISEADHGFTLNKTNLLAMDKAGVSDGVIDLMVALSFPKRFVIERASASGGDMGFSGSPIGWWDPFLSPMIPFSMLGRDCYSAFAYGAYYNCNQYLSAFGYGAGNYYPYSPYLAGGYPYSGWIAVGPGANNGSVTPDTGSAEGRVVNGRGYTQIRNREPVQVPTAHSGFGDSTSGGTSGTNSTGSSGVSSGGYSGGGSSGSDSGRTAVPRPPGGGQ